MKNTGKNALVTGQVLYVVTKIRIWERGTGNEERETGLHR